MKHDPYGGSFFREKEAMKFFRKNQKGFTLIEALIVVIIVAILAVLGIARFLGVREATAKATCFSHQSTLNAAVKKWQLDYPTATFSTADTVAMTADNAKDAYADAGSPTCPSGGVYQYEKKSVTIGSVTHTEYVSNCTKGLAVGAFAGHGPITP
jgi:type IV pilus assembly protein PilA